MHKNLVKFGSVVFKLCVIVGVQHSEKYTIMACRAEVKFNAQKGHEWMRMTVTFSKVVGYCKLRPLRQ